MRKLNRKPKRTKKYKYAPKLVDDARLVSQIYLPTDVHKELIRIARKEKKSVSWVVGEVVVDYFELRDFYPEIKRK